MKARFIPPNYWLPIVVALAMFRVAPLYANELSRQFIEHGAAELGRGNPAAALVDFQQAKQADPQDGAAHFLAGVALNRLGRHGEALKSLQRAEQLETEFRDLYFELGWAYLFTHQYQHAVDALTHYEKIKPGRAVAQELLGRAFLGLNQDDKAEAAFREALRRDARLAPTCNYYLGAIALRRGEREQATRLLDAVVADQPATAAGRAARGLIEAQLADPRRWSFAASVAGGYDSNVVQLDASQPLPSVTKRHAVFSQVSLATGYDLLRTHADHVNVSYEIAASFYEGISSFDAIDQRLALRWRHRLNERLALNAALDNRYSRIGGESLSYELTLPLSLDTRLTDWAVLRLSYAFGYAENFLSVAPTLDRDGTAHTLGAMLFVQCPPHGATARVGYAHRWNNTKGSDYDYESDIVSAGVNLPLAWRTALDVSYMRLFERYDNPNSFSGFTVARRDDIDILRVELSKAIDARWSVWTVFNYVRDDSNLPTFDFERHAWTAGVTFRH